MLSKYSSWVGGQPIEKLFLILSITFGLIFIFVIPPLQGYDEPFHFLRAYQVSEGHISSERIGKIHAGGEIPVNVADMEATFFSNYVSEYDHQTSDTTNFHDYSYYLKTSSPGTTNKQIDFESTAVYSPVNYIPQALGIVVARILHLPILSYFYFGRLAKLAAFIALIYWAIKTIPFGKWVIFAVALLPATISTAATFSPDSFVVGVVAVIVAYFVKFLVSKKEASTRDLAIIGGLILAAVLLKQSYFPLVFLFIFLPYKKFGSLKRYLTANSLYVVVGLLIYAVWTIHTQAIADIIHITQLPGEVVNPTQQLHFVIHSPIKYAHILINNIVSPGQTLNYAVETVSWVSWKYIKPTYVFVLASYFTLFFAALITYSESTVKTAKRILQLPKYGSLLMITALIAVMYTIFYVTTSVTYGQTISGVQGRYFIPILPLFIPYLLCLRKPDIRIGKEIASSIMVNTCLLVLVVTVIEVVIVNFTTIRI